MALDYIECETQLYYYNGGWVNLMNVVATNSVYANIAHAVVNWQDVHDGYRYYDAKSYHYYWDSTEGSYYWVSHYPGVIYL